jgi:hypothetical protein
LSALIKNPQHPARDVFQKLQITSKIAIQVLGIAFAKPFALWVWVVFWVGNRGRWKRAGTRFQTVVETGTGKKYDARARRVCPLNVSRINKGGGDPLRLDW